jgi:prepilin-type N-terminal cleavage/methylation domain-containing protein
MKKINQKGFSIIEVLIVLAIAGLIMLIVFLAVPALQRNSRNNDYAAEANRYASAYQEAVSNKGGAALTASSSSDGSGTADADKVWSAANPKTFTTVNIAGTPASQGSSPADATAFSDTLYIRQNFKCASPDSWARSGGSVSPRQSAILFTKETRSGIVLVCQDI